MAKLRYPTTEAGWIRAILALQLDELHRAAVAAIIWWDQMGSLPAGTSNGRQLKAIADARQITDVDHTLIEQSLIRLGYDSISAKRRSSASKRDAGFRPRPPKRSSTSQEQHQ